ncbi:hypothetical protein ACUSIJ_29205 [Pseudochelatococcus sp. B33]
MHLTVPDPIDPAIEAIARHAYDRCHRPDDSFADLKQRVRFSKDDRGRLLQWLDYGRAVLSRRDGGQAEWSRASGG